MPWNERVDIVIGWFMDKKTPANLVMMYIEEPDESAHIYSPDSDKVNSQYRKKKNYQNLCQIWVEIASGRFDLFSIDFLHILINRFIILFCLS